MKLFFLPFPTVFSKRFFLRVVKSGLCGKELLFTKSLPNNKIFDWSKFKAFADDKINVNEKLKYVFGRIENIVGKGENASYQHFLLFL